MDTTQIFEWFERDRRTKHVVAAIFLILLVAGVYALVYATGGSRYGFLHSMYIPILLFGFLFGTRGGIFIGLLGGIVLGPFMPINTDTGEQQELINWLYRMGFFVLIGGLSGAASDSVKSYTRHLKWLSRHNATTRLPNRNALFGYLSALAQEHRPARPMLLIVISLDNAIELKSAFGFHIIGETIRQMADRFMAGHDDLQIYHTDAGQLTLLASAEHGEEQLLQELMRLSQEPILYDDIPIHVDTRIGYFSFDRIEDAPESYLQKAEAALTDAFKTSQDCVAFRPTILSEAEQNLSNLGELKHAITEQQLQLYYQPKILLATGEVYGVEALMRWIHPQRGMIPPGAFIPQAEQSTLIHLLTEYALDQAMAQMMQWKQKGIEVSVAVNLSPQNLLQPGFINLIMALLDRHVMDGASLELEITENVLVRDMDRVIDHLLLLADANMIISIDDFGTGYSSLQYLHRLPISQIKIDQSFVRRLYSDQGAEHIVDTAVALAHKMGIKTVAEGVETQEQYDYLVNIGCDIIQGFLVSRPVPAADFETWYQQCNGRYQMAPRQISRGVS